MEAVVAEETKQPRPEKEKFKYYALSPQDIQTNWAHIEPFIERILPKLRDQTMETLMRALLDPQIEMHLWACVRHREIKALICFEFRTSETGFKLAHSLWMVGQNMKKWIPDFRAPLYAWCKQNNVDHIVVLAPWALQRYWPEWKRSHVLMEPPEDWKENANVS